MYYKQFFGLAGASIIAVAVFLPAWSVPIAGAKTIWDIKTTNHGFTISAEGILLLTFATMAMVMAFAGWSKAVFAPGLLSLLVSGAAFCRMEATFARARDAMRGPELSDRIIRTVAESISYGPAWTVMAVGVILLVAASVCPEQFDNHPANRYPTSLSRPTF